MEPSIYSGDRIGRQPDPFCAKFAIASKQAALRTPLPIPFACFRYYTIHQTFRVCHPILLDYAAANLSRDRTVPLMVDKPFQVFSTVRQPSILRVTSCGVLLIPARKGLQGVIDTIITQWDCRYSPHSAFVLLSVLPISRFPRIEVP